MDIYVRTRGLEKDYRFLGEAPAEFWWREYRAWTDTEGPTILLESDAGSWRAYLAGISSARRDLSDRPIQFNLALAGPHEPAGERFVLSVLAVTLADLAAGGGGSISGRALDERLPQEVVERLLAGSGEETRQEASAAVLSAYGGGPDVVAEGGGGEPATWTGGVANEQARSLFLARAAGLLSGDQGHALVLNLLATAADADQLVETGTFAETGSLAVLAARSGSPLDGEVTELAVKKGQPSQVLQPYQAPGPARPFRPLARLATLAGAAATAVLARLTRLVPARLAPASPRPQAPPRAGRNRTR